MAVLNHSAQNKDVLPELAGTYFNHLVYCLEYYVYYNNIIVLSCPSTSDICNEN